MSLTPTNATRAPIDLDQAKKAAQGSSVDLTTESIYVRVSEIEQALNGKIAADPFAKRWEFELRPPYGQGGPLDRKAGIRVAIKFDDSEQYNATVEPGRVPKIVVTPK